MKSHYTYLLTDKVNSMFYFGVRSCEGSPEDDNYMGSSRYVNEAVENGVEFIKVVSATYSSREEANKAEEDFLKSLDCGRDENWYNKSNGAKNFCTEGIPMSESHKDTLIKLSTERWSNGEMNVNVESTKKRWAEGKMSHVPFLAGKKIREGGTKVSLRGENRTDTQKANDKVNKPFLGVKRDSHSIYMSENNPFKGKHHSEDMKKHLSEMALKREKVECPHCKAVAGKAMAKRWHFDNCKHKLEGVA